MKQKLLLKFGHILHFLLLSIIVSGEEIQNPAESKLKPFGGNVVLARSEYFRASRSQFSVCIRNMKKMVGIAFSNAIALP
jgi:hypothetical protein